MAQRQATTVITDYRGRKVRLTGERWQHVIEHAEMAGQLPRLRSTLRSPDRVLLSRLDTSVHLYYRRFERTPVTSKHLMVAVKDLDDDAFVITAFFTGEVKGGAEIWAK
jgi:hypothetical protein